MQHYITQESLDKMKKKLARLETEERLKVAEEIKGAAAFGDLKENSEYDAAKNHQGFLEGKIAQLANTIKNVKIIEKSQNDKVQVGSKVTVVVKGETKKFEIVGIGESNPREGKISYETPISKALLGKSAGDKTEIMFSAGPVEYEIIEIE